MPVSVMAFPACPSLPVNVNREGVTAVPRTL